MHKAEARASDGLSDKEWLALIGLRMALTFPAGCIAQAKFAGSASGSTRRWLTAVI
jgi:hypothetical protein